MRRGGAYRSLEAEELSSHCGRDSLRTAGGGDSDQTLGAAWLGRDPMINLPDSGIQRIPGIVSGASAEGVRLQNMFCCVFWSRCLSGWCRPRINNNPRSEASGSSPLSLNQLKPQTHSHPQPQPQPQYHPPQLIMPRAEVGSLKHLNNKMKSKGLQRLRWYCQVCEKQCRDENGFKCHTQSESHVRQMLVIGEDAKKFISDYTSQFQRDFLQLLRTSHGEKKINANHFYQEYIANKEHVHMNATKWISLSEFVKFLGREGICRVEDDEKGLFVSWVDNSPDALRRQEAIRKKERQDRGDEEREQKAIREQVERANRDADAAGRLGEDEETKALKREEGEKITLAFGAKKTSTSPPPADGVDKKGENESKEGSKKGSENVSMKIVPKKPKNIFAAGKKKDSKNDSKKAGAVSDIPKRPMSEAERIMKEGMEKKRLRGGAPSAGGLKRQRVM